MGPNLCYFDPKQFAFAGEFEVDLSARTRLTPMIGLIATPLVTVSVPAELRGSECIEHMSFPVVHNVWLLYLPNLKACCSFFFFMQIGPIIACTAQSDTKPKLPSRHFYALLHNTNVLLE